MENKKDLAKIALTALLLSAVTPVSGIQADHGQAVEGTLLAAGCGAHGCPATPPSQSRNVIADTSNDTYNTRSGSYPAGGNYNQNQSYRVNVEAGDNYPGTTNRYSETRTSTSGYDNSTGDYRESNAGYRSPTRGSGDNYSNGNYNSQRTDAARPGYVEYRSSTTTYDAPPSGYGEYSGTTTIDRDASDYNSNRSTVTTQSSGTLTEAQLLVLLNAQGRAIYLSLDPEGKALAIQLAGQDSYRDKNLAVKEAQRRMNDRRGLNNR